MTAGIKLTEVQIHQLRDEYRKLSNGRAVARKLGLHIDSVARYTRDLRAPVAPIIGDLTWQDDAACRGYSTDTFFPYGPSDHETIKQARQICADCPVVASCLAYANNTRSVGIFGGRFIDYGKSHHAKTEAA